MDNAYNNIDIEKLKSTLITVRSINNSLETTDISKYFIDIESYLRKINFEHGNCIYNYREEINSILDRLEKVKENIRSLENGISTTIDKFQTVEHREVTPQTTTSNVTQINQETTGQVQENTNNQINTVPIGLGIAATGIAASAGAIVLDSMKDKRKEENKKELEEKNSTEVEEQAKETAVFDNGPYHASRNNDSMKNKFYGTKITDYYEKEDNEDTTNS